MKMYIWAGKLD